MNWGKALALACALGVWASGSRICAEDATLPPGVKAEWDMGKAKHETTATSERICINGLWKFQPAGEVGTAVPTDNWGYFKVPGAWSGTEQTIFASPAWKAKTAGSVAWYQREITVPKSWDGRRVAVAAEYVNSYAGVYVDGKKAGEIYFPAGEADITSAVRPGETQVISLCVQAVPLGAVMQAFNDTSAPKEVKGTVELKGLCGDVWLMSTPKGARVGDVRVETSVRKWEIGFNTELAGLEAGKSYQLLASVSDGKRTVQEFKGGLFKAESLKEGRTTFTAKWRADKLWDVHTPGNVYWATVKVADSTGRVVDEFRPVRFGFREFWIQGRDFYLNGSRISALIIPIDNALGAASTATYDTCRRTLSRYKALGVGIVYTHNYGCPPGAHLSYDALLRAADDVGVLVSLSQPHCDHYKWTAPDAPETNGYKYLAKWYVKVAGNHPAVVFYSMNHNAMSYPGSFNPDVIDGLRNAKNEIGPRTDAQAVKGLAAQAIVEKLDPTRVVYHHHSANLGNAYTSNLYLNFAPIQERCDWFEHWAKDGVKPLILVEYGAPWGINWTMYRGWYKGERDFGGLDAQWELTTGEWNSQFLGDRAFNLTEPEKVDLRWEADKWRKGESWHRWDYPRPPIYSHSVGFTNNEEVWALYITDMNRAFRTVGVSAWNYWSFEQFIGLSDKVDRKRKDLAVDWDTLQAPGISPDYLDEGRRRIPYFEDKDWTATPATNALLLNNGPCLAYMGDRAEHVTGKGHNYFLGDTVKKQLVIINNSRQGVSCESSIQFALPKVMSDTGKAFVETGNKAMMPIVYEIPVGTKPGSYTLSATVKFSTGETQKDSFAVDVVARPDPVKASSRIALFDPKGETEKLLKGMGVNFDKVDAKADLGKYDLFIVGKSALSVDGPAPDISRVRDGLRVVVFEQTNDVLEKRFGFRSQEYGLRNAFARVPDHPMLAGLGTDNLHDWHGDATLTPTRLTNFQYKVMHGAVVQWCGLEVARPFRAGNRGNVASVLIEKPARGNFLPIVDGGYSLQFSPLMEYREGKGVMVFCQLDVTGRTEEDPAAKRLAGNILNYVASYNPATGRSVLYAGEEAGKKHLEAMGLRVSVLDAKGPEMNDVLIVGPGGAQAMGNVAEAVQTWVKTGGRVLVLGLSAKEANSFLPMTVTAKEGEYISTVFAPTGMASPLAGVNCADVMNRDPRNVELITGGLTPVGNGVLGVSAQGNVVMCQLAPWKFDYQKYYNQKRTFRRVSYLVTRVLGNLGASEPTPILDRFSTPAKPADTRYLDGLYLDKPVEMDDPYRWFGW